MVPGLKIKAKGLTTGQAFSVLVQMFEEYGAVSGASCEYIQRGFLGVVFAAAGQSMFQSESRCRGSWESESGGGGVFYFKLR
jgi:hypothetical protein